MNTGKIEDIMANKLTHAQKGILDDQLFALRDKTVNGVRDFDAVRRALQDIIEGKLPLMSPNVPAWWRTAEQQLERARQLWPNAVLPEPPAVFTPWTKSEVLLLHVPDTFDNLWDKVAPTGYTTSREECSDSTTLRLAPNKVEYTEPVWLAFDPEHGVGKRTDSFWRRTDINLAASEVFSAFIQFPDWHLMWFKGASAPKFAGYQISFNDGKWNNVPYVVRLAGLRELELTRGYAGANSDMWASPTVREC